MRDQRWWTWHITAGIAVLVLLGAHMAVMHLDAILGVFNVHGTEAIDWVNVAARGQRAMYAVTYTVLLAAALFHGFYGLRNIVFELNPGPRLKPVISGTLAVIGTGLFGIGTWAAWASFSLARQL